MNKGESSLTVEIIRALGLWNIRGRKMRGKKGKPAKKQQKRIKKKHKRQKNEEKFNIRGKDMRWSLMICFAAVSIALIVCLAIRQ